MNRKNAFRLFLAVVIINLSGYAFAQAIDAQNRDLSAARSVIGLDADIGNQWFVFIGIDKYRSIAWPNLRHPVKDCQELKAILENDYIVDTTIELYDSAATAQGIYALFEDLQRRCATADSVFIFYSGYSRLSTVTDLGYIIPTDGGSTPGLGWISNGELRGMIRKLPSRHVLLVMDSFFSNDVLDDELSSRPSPNLEYFRESYARQARQVLASGVQETAPGVSEFVAALKIALRGNSELFLDSLSLFAGIQAAMGQTPPIFGNLRDALHQDGGNHLLFAKNHGNATALAASAADPGAGRASTDGRPPYELREIAALNLGSGEYVNDILADPGSDSWAVFSVKEESGILKKKQRFYVTLSGVPAQRLGPMSYCYAGDEGTWVAFDGVKKTWVGDTRTVVGAMDGYGVLGMPVSLEDRRLAFIADTATECVLVVGEDRIGTFDYIYGLERSPDGSSYVAKAMMNNWKDYYLIHNGEAYGPYDTSVDCVWSPDGRKFAYATRSGNMAIIRDADVLLEYDGEIQELCYAPDGETLVFIVKTGSQYRIIAGEEELGPFYESITGLKFAAGGSFAFMKNTANRSFVVVDMETTYGPFDPWNVQYGFADDGTTFYLSGRLVNSDHPSYQVVIDKMSFDVESQAYTAFPVMNKSGERTAFIADISWQDGWRFNGDPASPMVAMELGYGLIADGTPVFWTEGDAGVNFMMGNKVYENFERAVDVGDEDNFRWLAIRSGELFEIVLPR